jgi:dTDP-4-dehydrorhamnose 3,5-epimerase
MEIQKTAIEGLLIIQPKVFQDSRGYFFETYNKGVFENLGLNLDIVQSNISQSDKGVVRGLHYQNPPFAQGKLVRVLRGSVLDVAVDIRKESPTYGQHLIVELSESNKTALWIPPGFAHGFRTMEDKTIFFYDCTGMYNKASEGSILWNDDTLGIDWGIATPSLSDKDANAPSFSACNNLF